VVLELTPNARRLPLLSYVLRSPQRSLAQRLLGFSRSLRDTDIPCSSRTSLRKPSQKGKGTRKTKKLECLLEDECGVESVMRDTGLLLESLPLASEDWAADVVRLRKSSYRSSRHAFKLESPLGFEKFSGKALQTHAMATFHTTCTLATTLCTKPATDGEHGNLDEG